MPNEELKKALKFLYGGLYALASLIRSYGASDPQIRSGVYNMVTQAIELIEILKRLGEDSFAKEVEMKYLEISAGYNKPGFDVNKIYKFASRLLNTEILNKFGFKLSDIQ